MNNDRGSSLKLTSTHMHTCTYNNNKTPTTKYYIWKQERLPVREPRWAGTSQREAKKRGWSISHYKREDDKLVWDWKGASVLVRRELSKWRKEKHPLTCHDLISISFRGPAAVPLMFTKGHVIAQGKGEAYNKPGCRRGKDRRESLGTWKEGEEESKCSWEQN